jgi:hypothetical protein
MAGDESGERYATGSSGIGARTINKRQKDQKKRCHNYEKSCFEEKRRCPILLSSLLGMQRSCEVQDYDSHDGFV